MNSFKNENIKVSVIIPCCNVEFYIEECVESVLAQLYKNIEIILIDNNSEDNTKQIISNYVIKYPSQISVYHEIKQGAPYARNLGIEKSKGDWIQFLDADDLLRPEKIQNQVRLIDEKTAVIYGLAVKKNLKGDFSKMSISEDIVEGLFSTKLGITSSNLFKKENLLKIGGWNVILKSSQEYDLMIELFKINSKFKMDPKEYTIVRERESGQISSNKLKWRNYLDVRMNLYLFLLKRKYKLNKSHKKAISNAFLMSSKFHKAHVFNILKRNKSLLLIIDFKTQLYILLNIVFYWKGNNYYK